MNQFHGFKFHPQHTWIKAEQNDCYVIGITPHAQEQLGDVVFVQSPEMGAKLAQGEVCGVIESVKTAADLHAPASGEVVALNPVITDFPERLNSDPLVTWIVKIKLANPNEIEDLLDEAAYQQQLG